MAALPSTGSNCTLVIGDFSYGIKLFEIPNCGNAELPSNQSSGSSSTSSGADYSSFESLNSVAGLPKMGIAIGVSVFLIVVIGIVAVVVVLLKRKSLSEKPMEASNIEMASPAIRDIQIIETIGRGNFGSKTVYLCNL